MNKKKMGIAKQLALFLAALAVVIPAAVGGLSYLLNKSSNSASSLAALARETN